MPKGIIMRRDCLEQIVQWKGKRNRKPLVLMGARQVGKTWLMKEFGKQAYEKTVYINFDSNSRMAELFSSDLEIGRIIMGLELYSDVKITPENTLIIFDEVQIFPQARAAIKYLVADGRYDYIETGSLISIRKNVQGIVIPSEEMQLTLQPLDFEEFLWATGLLKLS